MTTTRQALVGLLEQHGHLTAEQVVAAAQDPSSPLHRHFEWDDTEAATRWRLSQAEHLIRRYQIVVEVEPERTVKVRAFTNVPGTGTYHDTAELLRDPAQRDLVMQQAVREIAALRAKYQALCDFDAAIAAEAKQRSRRKAS